MELRSNDYVQLRRLLEKMIGRTVSVTIEGKISKTGIVNDIIFKSFNIKMMLLEGDGVVRPFDFLFPFEYEVSKGCLLLNYHFEKINTLTSYDSVVELAQLQEIPHRLYQNDLKIQIRGRA